MNLTLPTSLEVCGTVYEIQSDFRAVLGILAALESNEWSEQDKALIALGIFYPAFSDMPLSHYEEALKKCFWFIDGGDVPKSGGKSPRVVKWEQDFPYIVAPINRVLGRDIRGEKEMHWWTFLSAYMEIGDCTFAQIVRIRDMRARGKRLDKADKEWYRRNRGIVDMKQDYTAAEKEFFENWK